MKYFWSTIIGMSFLLFTNCSTDEDVMNEVTIHDPIEIDIDEDGMADYKIKYSEVDIEPINLSDGTYGIFGLLQPYGKNEILRHRDEGYLFLRNLDELDENVVEPLKWRNTFSSTVVTITTINAMGEWPDKWNINSDTEHSTYFLGLKLVSDFEIQLAWLEIEINTTNGRISIIDKGII